MTKPPHYVLRCFRRPREMLTTAKPNCPHHQATSIWFNMGRGENIKSVERIILFVERENFAQSFQRNLNRFTKLKQMIRQVLKIIGTSGLQTNEERRVVRAQCRRYSSI